MSAEKVYNPFTGFTQKPKPASHNNAALGQKLKPVDWEKTKVVAGNWNVLDAKALQAAVDAKRRASGAAAVKAAAVSEEDAEKWRELHSITSFTSDVGSGQPLSGVKRPRTDEDVASVDPCPAPMLSFDGLLPFLPEFIQKKFESQGFKGPTPIQAQSWPILLRHRDMVGIAKTGSGKTLSFIIPAIAHIMAQDPLRHGDGPIVVVLAPTRELAQQIETETQKVLPTTMRCVCIYGGSPKGPQLQQLRQGAHIVVATPGRLIDFLEIQRLNLLRVTYLVLDEADRMLDMGFEPQVRQICTQLRPERQTLMFSATWPKEIQRLAATFLRKFIRIHVGSTELLANPDVTQRFVLTTEERKLGELKTILQQHRSKRILVFCKMKKMADHLEYKLKQFGFEVLAIHGDKEQAHREYVLDRFRKDARLCVVATDVAARGLDIKELEVVVNFDFPMQIDDYVHRIGRTGRAGAKGEAITLITKQESQVTFQTLETLRGILEKAKQPVPPWMGEWGTQLSYQVSKKGSSFTAFSRQRGGGLNAALHYKHTNRPSFDVTGDSGRAPAAPAPAAGSFFGVATQQYVRFHDSDNEDDGNAAAKKKQRHE